MKIIITEEQYKKIINESIPDRVKKLIIDFWKLQEEENGEALFDVGDLKYFGVYPDGPQRFFELSKMFFDFVGEEKIKKFLDGLLNREFSTQDFQDEDVGGYNFKWVINQYEIEKTKERNDVFLWFTILEGTVTLMMTEPNNTLDIFDAMKNKDYSWEIRYEIVDVINDCLRELVLQKTGLTLNILN